MKKKNRSRWNQLEASEVLSLIHVSKNLKKERRKVRLLRVRGPLL